MSAFASTPGDGNHPLLEPGEDWRGHGGLAGLAERLVSYGNWAGPGNRAKTEQSSSVDEKHARNPYVNEITDAAIASDPRYRPVDGLDAAAQQHDLDYIRSAQGHSGFDWEGTRNVVGADRKLVNAVRSEVETNGNEYSDSAKRYSQGLRGFFGARVAANDALDFTTDKMGEAGAGVSSFLDVAKQWHSLGDVGRGLAGGATRAGDWLSDTAIEASRGIGAAGHSVGDLGVAGTLGAVGGAGQFAFAGARHLLGEAWSGAKGLGAKLFAGASELFGHHAD
jgi:hypothetical protein